MEILATFVMFIIVVTVAAVTTTIFMIAVMITSSISCFFNTYNNVTINVFFTRKCDSFKITRRNSGPRSYFFIFKTVNSAIFVFFYL